MEKYPPYEEREQEKQAGQEKAGADLHELHADQDQTADKIRDDIAAERRDRRPLDPDPGNQEKVQKDIRRRAAGQNQHIRPGLLHDQKLIGRDLKQHLQKRRKKKIGSYDKALHIVSGKEKPVEKIAKGSDKDRCRKGDHAEVFEDPGIALHLIFLLHRGEGEVLPAPGEGRIDQLTDLSELRADGVDSGGPHIHEICDHQLVAGIKDPVDQKIREKRDRDRKKRS